MGWFDELFSKPSQTAASAGGNQQNSAAAQQQGILQGQGLNHSQYAQQAQQGAQSMSGLGQWLNQSGQSIGQHSNSIGQVITYTGTHPPQYFGTSRTSPEAIEKETRELVGRWLQIDPVEREAHLMVLRAQHTHAAIYQQPIAENFDSYPYRNLTLKELEESHNTAVTEKELLGG